MSLEFRDERDREVWLQVVTLRLHQGKSEEDAMEAADKVLAALNARSSGLVAKASNAV